MTNKKVGVFICQCGGNISDYVDTEWLQEFVKQEPSVASAQVNMFTCSDAGQQNIVNEIKEKGLDAIVVASCSPKLHLNTFRAAAKRAGLNQYQYTQVNIREQCSWAHTHNKKGATEKAARLVRAGVAKASLSTPLEKIRVETLPHVLVIGAGVAGLRAALALSDLGTNVYIVEKSAAAGGMVAKWADLYPSNRKGSQIVESLLKEIQLRDNIVLFTSAQVVSKEGHVGDFTVKISLEQSNVVKVKVGAIIVATGFESYTPAPGEFGYGLPGVVTLPEYEELLAQHRGTLNYLGKAVRNIAYIYCVGSRETSNVPNPHTYCSRYCCNAACYLSTRSSDLFGVNQYHLYRDIRTYGKHELLYEQALKKGAIFLRYDEDSPPNVSRDNGKLTVRCKDKLTGGEEFEVTADLVVLVTGMVPRENSALLDVIKLPTGKDGFFNEIHPKLRPVETVIDGVMIAGTAQGPKTISESVTSSMAAVSKVAALLLKGYVELEPIVAAVDSNLCTWCGECMNACPYGAIESVTTDGKEIATVSPVLCKGEGACVPVCPYQAIDVKGYSNNQISQMIDALAKDVKEGEAHAQPVGSAQR